MNAICYLLRIGYVWRYLPRDPVSGAHRQLSPAPAGAGEVRFWEELHVALCKEAALCESPDRYSRLRDPARYSGYGQGSELGLTTIKKVTARPSFGGDELRMQPSDANASEPGSTQPSARAFSPLNDLGFCPEGTITAAEGTLPRSNPFILFSFRHETDTLGLKQSPR